MDAFMRMASSGSILISVILLQIAAAALVVYLLKKLLERELFLAMLEHIAGRSMTSAEIPEVVVVAAGLFSARDEARLRAVIKGRFPQADIILGQDPSLMGGFILRAGDQVIDLSLSTRIKHLFRLQA
jgi:F0F1-type ATP synthase delta subunit